VEEPSLKSRKSIAYRPSMTYATCSHQRDEHPRYSVFAYGCSDTAYNPIGRSDGSVYRYLPGNRDVLGEHPRQDVDSLRAMRNLMMPLECRLRLRLLPLSNGVFPSKVSGWGDGGGESLVGKYEDNVTSTTD
jgi:hypothetical protein